MAPKETLTFKTVGDCKIHADIYRGNGPGPSPTIVWLHGGALMFGNRDMLHPAQVELYVNAGYTVVAANYRLAPETKLPEILRDVQDVIAWVRREGPRLFGLDPTRLAIIGHSAGGYLTLLTGCYVRPRPRALVAFYGYGDIVGSWYSEPSPFYCQQRPVSEIEAAATVGKTEISESPRHDSADFDPAQDRSRFYLYCRQRGCWPQEVAGLDPRDEYDALLPFCPLEQVTADYPPALLLHGDEDTDVPYEQSVLMARALAKANIPQQLVTIRGGEHGFDDRMGDPEVTAAFRTVLAFLTQYV